MLNKKLHSFSLSLVGALALMLLSCGKEPVSGLDDLNNGCIEVRAIMVAQGLQKIKKTVADSLVIMVSAPDIDKTVRFSKKIASSVSIDTITAIPSGKNRVVRVYTTTKTGEIIHQDSVGTQTISLLPGEVALISSILVPTRGSIYIQLSEVPTSVDQIAVSFKSDSAEWSASVKRSPRINIALDKIPHKESGILSVHGISSTGDTLFFASRAIVFDACKDMTVPLDFVAKPGTIESTIKIKEPSSTIVRSSVSDLLPDAIEESGTIIITEVMYSSKDSDFVELYNPGLEQFSRDTVLIDIDGVCKPLSGVTINAGEAIVIGKTKLPWVTISAESTTHIEFSTSGNWITIREKDYKVIDQVAVVGGSNALDWPTVSANRSIVLSQVKNDPDYNNYGKNWKVVTDTIEGDCIMYGTPGFR